MLISSASVRIHCRTLLEKEKDSGIVVGTQASLHPNPNKIRRLIFRLRLITDGIAMF